MPPYSQLAIETGIRPHLANHVDLRRWANPGEMIRAAYSAVKFDFALSKRNILVMSTDYVARFGSQNDEGPFYSLLSSDYQDNLVARHTVETLLTKV